MTYKVVEKFISINGEGQRSGELAVFIRLAHCNLDCLYCDTRWANEKKVAYTEMTKEDIKAYILETGVKNVTLTGGEPLLGQGIPLLIHHLTCDDQIRLEVETNGSQSIQAYRNNRSEALSFTLDYKSPSSQMEKHMDLENYENLVAWDTVKFVVGDLVDLKKAQKVILDHQLTKKCKVILSPIFGAIDMETIVDYMKEHKMNDVKLQMQLHKIIWEPTRIGV